MSTKQPLRSLLKMRKVVRFLTKHPHNDKYHGVLLAAHEQHLIFRVVDNFRFDGVLVLPMKQLKKVQGGQNEIVFDQIMFKEKKLAVPPCPAWILKAPSIEALVQAMLKRGLWPVVETRRGKETALYLGPVTNAGESSFSLYCYNSYGQWEKEYRLSYRDIFKIEFFDDYSTPFNAYMAKRPPAKEMTKV